MSKIFQELLAQEKMTRADSPILKNKGGKQKI